MEHLSLFEIQTRIERYTERRHEAKLFDMPKLLCVLTRKIQALMQIESRLLHQKRMHEIEIDFYLNEINIPEASQIFAQNGIMHMTDLDKNQILL